MNNVKNNLVEKYVYKAFTEINSQLWRTNECVYCITLTTHFICVYQSDEFSLNEKHKEQFGISFYHFLRTELNSNASSVSPSV